MTDTPDLKKVERRAYDAAYSDGALDVFVGLSLAWTGAAWIWLADYLSGALALVAVSISPALRARRRFVTARAGYVKFGEPRRRWERRTYLTAAALFAGFMLMARPLGSLEREDIDWPVGPDSVIVWLLALCAVGLGVLVGGKRLIAYAAVLASAGVVGVAANTSFGVPLLASGAVVLGAGLVLLRRFVTRNPRADNP